MAADGALKGKRVLVVGASSGIGRAVGLAAAAAGAAVGFAARRTELLAEAVSESEAAGGRAAALPCDVRDAAACRGLVAGMVGEFGGVDAVVYATGTSPLARLADADASVWQEVLETNLLGAALVTGAAIPHLRDSGGRVVFLSSSSVGRPYPGLVAYASSKAGLEEMVRGWRAEHPDVCFTRVVVGPTLTGFADGWDADLAAEMFAKWSEAGYAITDPMLPEQVAEEVVRVLASPVWLRDVDVSAAPAGPARPSLDV